MKPTNLSECGRFVVIDALHLDRYVFEALARWATDRGLRMQDAIQLAVCAFNDRNSVAALPKTPAPSSEHVVARSPFATTDSDAGIEASRARPSGQPKQRSSFDVNSVEASRPL